MLWHALQTISQALGTSRCYYRAGRFHFPLDACGETSLAVSGDSLSRVRLDLCHLGDRSASFWAFYGDDARLVSAVEGIRDGQAPSPTT